MVVVQMAYKDNLSFRILWIEIQYAKKTKDVPQTKLNPC